jgi:hypothetical protein
MPKSSRWIVQQDNRVIDLSQWNVHEAAESEIQVLQPQGILQNSQPSAWDTSQSFPNWAEEVFGLLSESTSAVVQLPRSSYVVLDIWMYAW